ncbi:MAG: hypothetical protein R2813_00820 [Flavobacteriales bacterium]
MKSNTYSIIAVMALSMAAFTFSSCKKEGCMDETATNYDAEAKKDDGNCEYADPEPVIKFTISSPEEHSTFNLGETVHISATYETTEEVHGYSIKIINNSDNDDVVFSKEEHAHESPVHIHEEWVNNVTIHSDMTLEISITTDHDGGTETKSIGFHCMPM